jgi:hypothetical protein
VADKDGSLLAFSLALGRFLLSSAEVDACGDIAALALRLEPIASEPIFAPYFRVGLPKPGRPHGVAATYSGRDGG